MNRISRHFITIALLVALSGLFCCLNADKAQKTSVVDEVTQTKNSLEMAPAPAKATALTDKDVSGKATSSSAEIPLKQPSVPAAANRKLIKNGWMTIEVKDALEARNSIIEGLTKLGGFVSGSQLRLIGDHVEINLVIRTPSDKFDELLDLCRKGSKVADERMQVEDVTDEYVDLEARLKNAERLEERLLDILKMKTSKLSDLLEVERELARVREEIERMIAQRRSMDGRISLSTLNLTISERIPSKIKAPESVWGPAVHVFSNLPIYFERSMAALAKAIAVLAIILIYVLPWAAILFVLIVILRKVWRRRNAAKEKETK